MDTLNLRNGDKVRFVIKQAYIDVHLTGELVRREPRSLGGKYVIQCFYLGEMQKVKVNGSAIYEKVTK